MIVRLMNQRLIYQIVDFGILFLFYKHVDTYIQDEICDDNDDCFNLTDEMTKLEEKAKQEEESAKPVFQMNQMSSGKADCKIRKNNYISCAAVQQQERMDNIKTGL